jgi:hypothetical protein
VIIGRFLPVLEVLEGDIPAPSIVQTLATIEYCWAENDKGTVAAVLLVLVLVLE